MVKTVYDFSKKLSLQFTLKAPAVCITELISYVAVCAMTCNS